MNPEGTIPEGMILLKVSRGFEGMVESLRIVGATLTRLGSDRTIRYVSDEIYIG